MRVGSAFVVVAAALSASSAHASVAIAWDCFLSSGPVTCTDLENTFFSNKIFAHAPAVSDVAIEVRAIAVANATRYDLTLRTGEEHVTYRDTVPQEFSPNAVLLRLVSDLDKDIAPFLLVDEPAKVGDDGFLHLSLRDPSEGPRKARADDETTGLYVAPSLTFNGDHYGVVEVAGRANVDVNYSNPRIRVQGFNWTGYRYAHTDDTTFAPADRTYQNVDWGTYWIVSRTLWRGLSVAMEGQLESEPQVNEAFRANTYAGVEWVLTPFLKTDEGNVGVQYVMGAEYYKFVYENVQLKNELYWLRHRLTVSGTWHFPVVDVNGTLSYAGMVNDPHFSSFSSGAGVTWHLLDDLALSANGDVSYRLGLVEEPHDLTQIPPLAQFYGGSAYGAVTWDFSVTLQYVFGNSLLLHQDQRWK